MAAAAVVGTIRNSTASRGGATSSCTYTGTGALMKLSLTQTANAGNAHTQFVQAERYAGRAARGAFIGDEGFSYPGGITTRVGQVLLVITGSPPPNPAALETAAATVVKQL
jgi:hypothetical protein